MRRGACHNFKGEMALGASGLSARNTMRKHAKPVKLQAVIFVHNGGQSFSALTHWQPATPR
jgi:hypothetical protein